MKEYVIKMNDSFLQSTKAFVKEIYNNGLTALVSMEDFAKAFNYQEACDIAFAICKNFNNPQACEVIEK